jgi:hypothetical protein
MTAREIADRVRSTRKVAWEKFDPTQAVVWSQELNPDDRQAVERAVASAGFSGDEAEEMVRQVTGILIRHITAMDDSQPADGAD